MGRVVGLAICKINGLFELDVINSNWDIKKAIATHHTGGGLELASGLEVATGTFDEVIAKAGGTDWRSLTEFSVEILDKQTRQTIAAFAFCEWSDLAGAHQTANASSTKRVAWSAKQVLKG